MKILQLSHPFQPCQYAFIRHGLCEPLVDTVSFIAHYVPYMCFQMSLLQIAIDQVQYISEKDIVPFNISRGLLRFYLALVAATFIYYKVFIQSFLVGYPILDTTIEWKKNFGKFIMYFWDLVAFLIPMVFGLLEIKFYELNSTIVFYLNYVSLKVG